MARYRKIDVRIWNDEKFRALTDDGKLAFLFILTHPSMTALGAMRATIAGLAAELGWSVRRLRSALEPTFNDRMIVVDEAAAFLRVRNFLRYNAPENGNQVKAWSTAVEQIPECAAKFELLADARAVVENLGEPFSRAFIERLGERFLERSSEPFGYGSPNQEQEQEQEQEQNQKRSVEPEEEIETSCRSERGWGREVTEPCQQGGNGQNHQDLETEERAEPRHPAEIAGRVLEFWKESGFPLPGDRSSWIGPLVEVCGRKSLGDWMYLLAQLSPSSASSPPLRTARPTSP